MLMAFLGIPTPIINIFKGAVGNSIVTTVNTIVYQVITSISSALASLAGALLTHILKSSNSAAEVTGTSFTTLYQAMFLPAMTVAIIVLIVGVISSGIHGNPREIVKRAVLTPIIVIVAVGMAAGVTNDALHLVGWIDSTYLTAVFGHPNFGSGIGKLGPAPTSALFTHIGASSFASLGMALFNTVVFFLLLLASMAVWAEMQVRVLVVWLMVVLIPLGAAMLFWRGTERLFKRVVEMLIAAILLPFPITVVLAVGIKVGDASGSLSKLFITLVSVGMAAFMLPALMKLVPLVETAVGVGIGSSMASKARGKAASFGNQAAGAATANSGNSAIKRLSGAAEHNGGSFVKGATSLAATGVGTGAAMGAGLAIKATKSAAGSASQRLRSGVGGVSSRLRGGTAQAGGGSAPGAPPGSGLAGTGGTTTLTDNPETAPTAQTPATETDLAGRQAGVASEPTGHAPVGEEPVVAAQQSMFDADVTGGAASAAHPGAVPGRPVKNTGTPAGPCPGDKIVKNAPPVTPRSGGNTSGTPATGTPGTPPRALRSGGSTSSAPRTPGGSPDTSAAHGGAQPAPSAPGGSPAAPRTQPTTRGAGAVPGRPVKNTGTPSGPGPNDKIIKNTPPDPTPPAQGTTSAPPPAK